MVDLPEAVHIHTCADCGRQWNHAWNNCDDPEPWRCPGGCTSATDAARREVRSGR